MQNISIKELFKYSFQHYYPLSKNILSVSVCGYREPTEEERRKVISDNENLMLMKPEGEKVTVNLVLT